MESNYQKYLKDVGVKIADKRHLRGEKLATMALAVNMPHGMISQIENGRYDSLKVKTLIELANYLEIPLADLYPPPEIAEKFV
jgi:transcriptional regulator with XRE-family HTH domain